MSTAVKEDRGSSISHPDGLRKKRVRWGTTFVLFSAILIVSVVLNLRLTIRTALISQTPGFQQAESNSSSLISLWEQIGNAILPASSEFLLASASAESNISHTNETRVNSIEVAHRREPIPSSFIKDRFTIVVNTFRNRDKSVLAILKYYAKCLEDRPHSFLLDRMVVVWNDFERQVPAFLSGFAESSQSNTTSFGHTFVEVQNSTNLTNRFRLQPSIRTEAIYSTDDDEFFVCYALEYAFAAWREDPLQRMVGFTPRILAKPTGSVQVERGKTTDLYYAWDAAFREREYDSLFVTKGGFLHRRFYQAFHEDDRLAQVREFVDEHTTGEDILMAVCHAMHARNHTNAYAASSYSSTTNTSNIGVVNESKDILEKGTEDTADIVVAFALQKERMRMIVDGQGEKYVFSLGMRTAEHRRKVFQLLCDSISRQVIVELGPSSCWLPVLQGSTTNRWCVIAADTTYTCQAPLPRGWSGVKG